MGGTNSGAGASSLYGDVGKIDLVFDKGATHLAAFFRHIAFHFLAVDWISIFGIRKQTPFEVALCGCYEFPRNLIFSPLTFVVPRVPLAEE